MNIRTIRNFCIIAHIDHGKSTLADRFLEMTKSISERDMKDQALDSMDLERERGITIKASAVHMLAMVKGTELSLNLIDTPGHVDFNYEVSRALAACEGALLLVDASQGVEAQTMANFYLALEANLTIIPVINKIDMPAARPEEVITEMESLLGVTRDEVLQVSARTGVGVEALMEAIAERVPPPKGDPGAPLRALVFDSHYDEFRGVIVYVRIVDGVLKPGEHIKMMGAQRTYEVDEIGVFSPGMTPVKELKAGQVGYFIASIRSIHDVRTGDTVTHRKIDVEPLPGYVEPKPMVFCGLYPTESDEFEDLRRALARLHLNDSSFTYVPENSGALGFGFRCGFLGMLHMDIVKERLEREAGLDLVQTAPNVTYQAKLRSGETIEVNTPSELPDSGKLEELLEPVVELSIIVPAESVGTVMQLATDRRGQWRRTEYLGPTRILLTYDIPLAEIIFDFYDILKSATRGYGTMDYTLRGFQAADLVRVRILVSGIEVDSLSSIVHRSQAENVGRKILVRLRKEIPRHLFEVPLQAAIGGKVIARESISAMRKNVTAKCYGGDITRKRKLIEKQKEGKKRMKMVGRVEIPKQAFLSVLGEGQDVRKSDRGR